MLAIPQPCNEDFSKMTPTERGAFCGKCQIDTYDFRDLTDEKINSILVANKGKHLCGQFKNSQLESLNAGYLSWKQKKSRVIRSKFLLALILVFGLGLFSCSTQEDRQLMETFATQLAIQPKDKTQFVNEIETPEALNLIDYVQPPECFEMGEVEYCSTDTPAVEVTVTAANVDNNHMYRTAGIPVALGGAVMNIDYMSYLEDTVDIVVESDKVDDGPNLEFKLNAFPNPTRNNATVSLEVIESANYLVEVYDMSGRLIQSIYNGELSAGIQQFEVQLQDQQAGMYIVRTVSGEQQKTFKIQKVNQ